MFVEDTIDSALELGLILQGGAWFSIIDFETGSVIEKVSGKKSVVKYCHEHPEYFDLLSDKVQEGLSNYDR